ncbi:hypothetical protein [Streptomyces bambusae]|uniref:DUF3592 domain-containing protein n=1 Tax=Streptomyces bambusae TaxID=1550616 RepID=A0ABS6Z7Q5_9ACTN|nr:hypothetical protein [Streptomyces bambusae]MBW5483794.1 hypothetical protein [Streptomyces bambusae]
MTASPSAPILRGSGGTVLRHEGDVLTLRRGDEETRIPLRAVRDVVPDRRAVIVELRAPAGGTPVTHRIDGVNEASAGLFATTLGTALARLPEPDPSFDGAALVTTRSLRTPPPPAPPISAGQKARGLAWVLVALGPGLASLIVTSVLFVLHGEAGMLILAIPMGLVSVFLNLASAAAAERSLQMWLLPWRGITVMAVRTSPYGKSGKYEYTDSSGTLHSYYRDAYASRIEISYHPENPGNPVGVYPVFTRVVVALGTLILCAVTAGVIFVGVMAATV